MITSTEPITTNPHASYDKMKAKRSSSLVKKVNTDDLYRSDGLGGP